MHELALGPPDCPPPSPILHRSQPTISRTTTVVKVRLRYRSSVSTASVQRTFNGTILLHVDGSVVKACETDTLLDVTVVVDGKASEAFVV